LGFLNGLLLFGLLGSLVPLVIHLLERRKLPRLEFPSLRFLRELNRRQMRRLNLQRLLILILRMLLVALIAFALARPTLLGPLAALFPEDAPRAVALLIDNSASMLLESETGTLAEQARRRARAILAELDPERDEVLLYSVETTPRDLGGGPLPAPTALRLLDEWRDAEGGAAFAPALRRALSELSMMPQPRRELFLLSDFAAATLLADSVSQTLPAGIGEIRVVALPQSENPPPNTSLTQIRLPARPVLPGRSFELGVAGRAWGVSETEPFPVELELAGEHRGGLQMEPAVGREQWRSMQVSITGERELVGVWRKQRDRFAPDDALPFTLPVAPRLRVLLTSPDASAERRGARLGLAEHVARALDPFRGAAPGKIALDLERLPVAELVSDRLTGASPHLAVLCGGEGLDRSRGRLLADYVEAGGGLLICPDREGLDELARHLLPRLGGPRALEVVEGAEEYLAELDPEHPAFTDFEKEHLAVLGEQPLWRSFRTRPGDREIPARFRSGRPALLAWEHGAGRVRLLLFEAGPEGGELPYSSMFLPFLQELAQEAVGASRPLLVEAGQPLQWPLRAPPEREELLQVLTPAGEQVPARLDASVIPPRARLDRAGRAGIYRLQMRREGGGEPLDLGLAAVRVPAIEGDLTPLPPDSLGAALGLPGLEVIRPGEVFSEALAAGRFGKELARPLLLLAALLMAAELWFAQRAEREG